jgi:catechol 2,3-dioxygenase-like lactoylglutathione lyase family enzyme
MLSKLQINPVFASFHIGLVTERFYETWDFYTERLGFRTLEESNDAVLLVHASGARLGLLRHETDETHPERVSATDGRGFWLKLEVTDVEAEFERLRGYNVPVVDALRAGPHGERSFTLRDPNGVLIFVTRQTRPDFSSEERIVIVENTAC